MRRLLRWSRTSETRSTPNAEVLRASPSACQPVYPTFFSLAALVPEKWTCERTGAACTLGWHAEPRKQMLHSSFGFLSTVTSFMQPSSNVNSSE